MTDTITSYEIPERCPCLFPGCNDGEVVVKITGTSWGEIGTDVSEMCKDIDPKAITGSRRGYGSTYTFRISRKRALLLAADLAERYEISSSSGFDSSSTERRALRRDAQRVFEDIGCAATGITWKKGQI